MAETRSSAASNRAQEVAVAAAGISGVEAERLKAARSQINAQLDVIESQERIKQAQTAAEAKLGVVRARQAAQRASSESEGEPMTAPTPQQMNPNNPAGGIPTNPLAELGGVAGSLATNGSNAPMGQGGGVLGGAGVQQGMAGRVAGGQPMAPGAMQGGGLFGVPPTLTTTSQRTTTTPEQSPSGFWNDITTREVSRETTPNALSPYQYGQLMAERTKSQQAGKDAKIIALGKVVAFHPDKMVAADILRQVMTDPSFTSQALLSVALSAEAARAAVGAAGAARAAAWAAVGAAANKKFAQIVAEIMGPYPHA